MATVRNKDGVGGVDTSMPSPSQAKMVLKDGVTAPSKVAGMTQIYVDSADGDLKAKFGDGTTKVIVADT